LEIAEKLCAEKNLKYNIIFTTFGAEEMGLWGSRYFCNNPPVPLEQIKFMFNMDMIGRMDAEKQVYINTGKPNEKLNAVVDAIKKSHPGINTVPSFESYTSGSDHTSFYNKKIPVLFFITGLHDDYHKPTDTVEKINYEGEKSILDFVYDLVISPEIDDFIRSFTSSGVNP
jgi:Zn-dependent M28 family amino/carboxypeptidase